MHQFYENIINVINTHAGCTVNIQDLLLFNIYILLFFVNQEQTGMDTEKRFQTAKV